MTQLTAKEKAIEELEKSKNKKPKNNKSDRGTYVLPTDDDYGQEIRRNKNIKDLPMGLTPDQRDRFGPPPERLRTPGGITYEAKKGGLVKKYGIQSKGTSPLLKRKGK